MAGPSHVVVAGAFQRIRWRPSGRVPCRARGHGNDGHDLPASNVEQDLARLVYLDVRLRTAIPGPHDRHSAELAPGLAADEARARQPVGLLKRDHRVDELPGERLPEPRYPESQPGECARETVYVGAARTDREVARGDPDPGGERPRSQSVHRGDGEHGDEGAEARNGHGRGELAVTDHGGGRSHDSTAVPHRDRHAPGVRGRPDPCRQPRADECPTSRDGHTYPR